MLYYPTTYSQSYALVIVTQSRESEKEFKDLSNVLRNFPYQFRIDELIGDKATCNNIQQVLQDLARLPADSRILIVVSFI